LLTKTFLRPELRAAADTSRAYSRKTVGSVYVQEMEEQPRSSAYSTTSLGGMNSPGILPVSRGDWEISEFWQCRQRKLQPAVAMEYERLPG